MENGIETARGLLETEPEELLKIKGMTKKVLLEIRSILLGEFDEPETDEMIEKIKNLKAKSSRQKKVKVKVVAAEDKENPDATEES